MLDSCCVWVPNQSGALNNIVDYIVEYNIQIRIWVYVYIICMLQATCWPPYAQPFLCFYKSFGSCGPNSSGGSQKSTSQRPMVHHQSRFRMGFLFAPYSITRFDDLILPYTLEFHIKIFIFQIFLASRLTGNIHSGTGACGVASQEA